MRLTRSVSYGVSVLLQIHRYGGETPITAADIARGCRFPPRFLYRVLHRLVDGGLLRGTSGPGGGYALARRPEEISLLDIAVSVESAPQPSRLEPACARHRAAIARVNRLCRDSAEHFAALLGDVSLVDLEGGKLKPRRQSRRPVA